MWVRARRDTGRKRGKGPSRRSAGSSPPSPRKGKVRFASFSVRSVAAYFKLAAVFLIAAIYSYALFLQPLLAENAPYRPLFSSPLSRLAGVSSEQFRIAAASTDCGIPVTGSQPEAKWYGTVTETELPWFAEPPDELTRLRTKHNAHRLVAAFRTTLPNPMWDEPDNVALGASYLTGTVLQPGNSLSLFGIIGPFTRERGYGDGPMYSSGRIVPSLGGGVCKIATTVYNAIVYSDLHVIERKPHSMLVAYVPPGRDAAIATGAKDIRFRNDKDTPILLWAGMQETTLFVAVYGQYEPPTVQWHHEELARRPAPLERRLNPDLPPGTEQVIFAGYDGVTVRTWVTIDRPGQPTERRDMGVDTYRPLAGVIEYGE